MFSSILTGMMVFFLLYGRIDTGPLLAVAAGVVLICLLLRRGHHHGAFLSIDVQAQHSRLGDVHTGLKVCFAISCMLLCIAAGSVAVSLFLAVSMLLLTVCVGGTPLDYYLRLLRVPAIFILLGTVAILFEISRAPMGLWDMRLGGWYLSVTAAGQARALLVLCRAFGAVGCLYLLSLSTPLYRIIGALYRVKLPVIVIELMYLIYRYLFVLLEAQNQMRTAAGARLGYRTWRTSLKTMAHSSLNLLFVSFRRASDCFAAMESRCYDGRIAFLEEVVTLRRRDLFFAAGYVVLLSGVWYITGRMWI